MRGSAIWSAALLAAAAVCSDPASIQADPACDTKCRARKNFYFPGAGGTPGTYAKFADPTCEFCGPNSVCLEHENDKNTDGTLLC